MPRHYEVKAYHNICLLHRGNKLVWNDMPLEDDQRGCAAKSSASTTPGATTWTAT